MRRIDLLPDIPNIKVPIEEQIERLRLWNVELGLGFERVDFRKLEKVMWPLESFHPLEAVVVYFCLDTPFQTLAVYLRLLGTDIDQHAMPKTEADIRLWPGNDFRRGLFIEQVDLSAHWYRGYDIEEAYRESPGQIAATRPEVAPHFAILAVACQLDVWRDCLGDPAPYVFIPGLQLKSFSEGWEMATIYVPFLNIKIARATPGDRELNFDFCPVSSTWCWTYAIPEKTFFVAA